MVIIPGKNTLVILLQLYRLYVVLSESKKSAAIKRKMQYQNERYTKSSKGSRGKKRDSDEIYTISNEKSSKSKKRLVNEFSSLFSCLNLDYYFRKYDDSDDSDDKRKDKKK